LGFFIVLLARGGFRGHLLKKMGGGLLLLLKALHRALYVGDLAPVVDELPEVREDPRLPFLGPPPEGYLLLQLLRREFADALHDDPLRGVNVTEHLLDSIVLVPVVIWPASGRVLLVALDDAWDADVCDPGHVVEGPRDAVGFLSGLPLGVFLGDTLGCAAYRSEDVLRLVLQD